MRLLDPEFLAEHMAPYMDKVVGFDPHEWLSNPTNVALINELNDVALFERQYRQPNTVYGHYFFTSRGKQAKESAEEFLKEIFLDPDYGVEVIVGLTPVDHKGALRMNKWLGFESHGQIDTVSGSCEFVILTKTKWENSQNE